MRRLATGERIRAFLGALGRHAQRPARVYLTGGATAVLEGWRDATIDIDLLFVPDERGHPRDLEDVAAMLARGLVDGPAALEAFASVEHELYRYPAIDPPSFRRAVEAAFTLRGGQPHGRDDRALPAGGPPQTPSVFPNDSPETDS